MPDGGLTKGRNGSGLRPATLERLPELRSAFYWTSAAQ